MSSLPRATNGWTSPREPTTCITILRGGGGLAGSPSRHEDACAEIGGVAGSSCRAANWTCSICLARWVSASFTCISMRPSSGASLSLGHKRGVRWKVHLQPVSEYREIPGGDDKDSSYCYTLAECLRFAVDRLLLSSLLKP